MRGFLFILAAMALVVPTLACGGQANAAVFDGQADNQTDVLGYYYIMSGGLFTNGQTVNGTKTSGGAVARTFDDPMWGGIDTWVKDGWFAETAGFALTMKNGGQITYDNNGLENATYPGAGNSTNFYMYNPGDAYQGLYRGYSMSNIYDHIYAGYFILDEDITIDQMIGYFDPNGSTADTYPFDPASSLINYRMNIWSNVDVDQGTYTEKIPVNTGSFDGDVFSTDAVSGAFSWSDTGVDRGIIGAWTEDIYRLTFTLDTPITLSAGEYWFSHDAAAVPEPCTLAIWSLLGVAGIGLASRRRKR